MSARRQTLSAEIDMIRQALEKRWADPDTVREYAVRVLRSNQDTLLHDVPRTQAVLDQLEMNRLAIGVLAPAASPSPETDER